MPRVTLYITNLNYGQYLQQSIESALNQTYNDYEVLIIDDGSTDGSQEIISRYNKDDKVRIIFQSNKGLNASCNIALKAARGDYIMRLDADDYLDDNALSILASKLDNHRDVGLTFPDYYVVDAEGNILEHRRRHNFNGDSTNMLLDIPAHGACTMIRSDLLREMGGYNESFSCQDGYEMWLQFIERYKVANINLPLFYYRQHGTNLTTDENRLLRTRSMMLKEHAKATDKKELKGLAIIPIRGLGLDSYLNVFEEIGGKPLLCWTVDAACDTDSIEHVVVTSSSDQVLSFIEKKYSSLNVMCLERPNCLSYENVSLVDTINFVLESEVVRNEAMSSDIDTLVLLTVETPFRGSMYIEKAINKMRIFDVDSVIATIVESDMFYQHTKFGMRPMHPDEKLKLEKKELYRYVRGLTVVKKDYFQEHNRISGGRVGHIIMSKISGFHIKDTTDFEIANFLANKKLEQLK